jgi:hypothetical protein
VGEAPKKGRRRNASLLPHERFDDLMLMSSGYVFVTGVSVLPLCLLYANPVMGSSAQVAGPAPGGHPSFEAVSWAAKFSQFSFWPGLLRRRHALPGKHEIKRRVSWNWKKKRQHQMCDERYALGPTGLLTNRPSLSHANHPFSPPLFPSPGVLAMLTLLGGRK